MTRWARGGNANKRKPHDASTWDQLKQQFGKQSSETKKVRSKHDAESSFKRKQQQHGKGQKRTSVDKYGKQSQRKQIVGKRVDNTRKNQSSLSAELKMDQPGTSRDKSIIDVLLEADRAGSTRKKSDTDGGDGEKDVNQRFDTPELLEKREKRSEARRLKRQKNKADKMVCFHCRQPGHGISECPEMLEDNEQGTGICFRCGSTEHDVSRCTSKVDKKLGEFPYAKCFICQQTGHLSRTCPDNPRGLYPEGGGCKECGSVEHRWWNCPVRKPVKGVDISASSLTVDRSVHMSVDAEPAFMKKPKVKVKNSGPKVVVF